MRQGRQEKTSRGKTRQNKTRQTRQDKTRQDKTRRQDKKDKFVILTSELALLTSELTNSFANSDVLKLPVSYLFWPIQSNLGTA